MITFKAKTASGEIIKSLFSTFTFPAGEAHIKIEDRRSPEPVEIAIFQPDAESLHDDLIHLAMWADAVMRVAVGTKTVAIMPYFPGARADRGTPFGAQVYVDLVYSMMLGQVITYDPHSEVVIDLLKHDPGLKVTPVYPYEILGTHASKLVLPNIYDGVIAPDKGAKTRAGAVAETFGVPLFTATKVRDFNSGHLTGFGMEQSLLSNTGGSYLIVDDICDGGGTFVGLAEHLSENYEDLRLDLYVSHGVFSKDALVKLENTFSNVYTTNSYDPQRGLTTRVSEFQDESTCFHRIDVIRPLLERIVF